jgi:hypothetical protein
VGCGQYFAIELKVIDPDLMTLWPMIGFRLLYLRFDPLPLRNRLLKLSITHNFPSGISGLSIYLASNSTV